MPIPSRYVLFYSLRSPFARRVRIAFQRLGLSFEAREVNVFEPTPDFLAANPLGTVPVLLVNGKTGAPADRVAVPDSATILEYLHENHGERIWPADLTLRANVRAASTLAEGLMTETVRWYLENQRSAPSPEWNEEYLENLDRTLATISEGSLKSPPWKISDLQLTQAGYDLVIALEYMQLRLKGLDWPARYPELARFFENHRVRQDLALTAPPA
jgi:glutathione S-transferase